MLRNGHNSASLCPLLSSTPAAPSPWHLIFSQDPFVRCVQVKSWGFRSSEGRAFDRLRRDVQVSQELWPEPWCAHTSKVHLLFFLSFLIFFIFPRNVSDTAKGHRRATGMRTLYSGKVSCCFFNFLSGNWNVFHQKVGKDLEQNWSWLSKYLTTFCGKQPSVLGDINSRRYWWH